MDLKSIFAIILLATMGFLPACSTNDLVGTDSDKHGGPTYNPKAAKFNIRLGLAYLNRGNPQRAKSKLLAALKQNPKSPIAADAMGYYYEKTGNAADAERYYRRALKLAPKSGAALNNYGTYLCRQHRFPEAERLFNKAIADKSYVNVAEVFENAGLCSLRNKQADKAKYYFNKAVQEDSQRTESLLNLALLEYGDKEYQQSAQHLLRTDASLPKNPEVGALAQRLIAPLNKKRSGHFYANALKKRFVLHKH